MARFPIGIGGRVAPQERVIPIVVNGGPGFAVVNGTRARVVCAITVHNGLVSRLDFVLSPDKLPDLADHS